MIVSLVFYRLGFPNREEEDGFMKFLLPFYANTDKVDSPSRRERLCTPFASDTRKLFKIGVNFSNKTRNIETWKVVERNL